MRLGQRKCLLWQLAMLLVLALAQASTAHAGERIVWGVIDFPPFQIVGGPNRDTGSFDGLLEELTRRMPEYRHDILPMSFARREQEFIEGSQLCTPGVFRTPEREKQLTFSRPSLIHLDNRLVFLSSKAKVLGGDEPVDLEALFKNQRLLAGVFSSRSFAPNIDDAIKRHSGQQNLIVRAIKTPQMFELLLRGEIDYTIMFPHEAAYIARLYGMENAITVRKIKGTPPYCFTYTACAKGAWGESIVAKVDMILEQIQSDSKYQAYSERWYVNRDKATIRAYFQKMLRSN